MNIVYLIAPSEAKKFTSDSPSESVSFAFPKPQKIALHATEKDLKCKGKRYIEAKKLNQQVFQNTGIDSKEYQFLPAIERYSGVMYQALGYTDMTQEGQAYLNKHFYILSGMYGIVRPQDSIANYKLPIETKGLAAFWTPKISKALRQLGVDAVVDLLPESYAKMIDWKQIGAKRLKLSFVDANGKKLSHGVKSIRGAYIKNICQGDLADMVFDFPETELILKINS